MIISSKICLSVLSLMLLSAHIDAAAQQGACCDDALGECADNTAEVDCPPDHRFAPNTLCADLEPPCGEPCDNVPIIIEVRTDQVPGETTWELFDDFENLIASGGPYVNLETLHVRQVCVQPGCYWFTIYDTYGDGICCRRGQGYYNVYYDDSLFCSGGGFRSSESCQFGINCPDPTGACCVEHECVGTMTEAECQNLNGDWAFHSDCDSGFDCASFFPCENYVVGDFNASGVFNIADVVMAFRSLMWDSYPELFCQCPPGSGDFWYVRMDVNASCAFNIADVVSAFSKLKTGAPELAPCPECPPGP